MRIFTLVIFLLLNSIGYSVENEPSFFKTGNQLYSELNSSQDSWYTKGTGAGYIIGVIDTYEIEQFWDKQPDYICYDPTRVNVGQLVDIVKKYLTENPGTRDLPAASLVLAALAESFKCN